MVSNSGSEPEVGPGRAEDFGGGQYALGMALRRALAGYRRQMDDQLASAGLAGRKFPAGRVLRMCAGPGATTISDVGRALGITRQGASKIVSGLREQGYLAVTPSGDDGREKILSLTPRAIEALLAAYRAAVAIEQRVRREIGDEAMDQLFRVLDIVAGGEPADPEDRPVAPGAARLLHAWLEDQQQPQNDDLALPDRQPSPPPQHPSAQAPAARCFAHQAEGTDHEHGTARARFRPMPYRQGSVRRRNGER